MQHYCFTLMRILYHSNIFVMTLFYYVVTVTLSCHHPINIATVSSLPEINQDIAVQQWVLLVFCNRAMNLIWLTSKVS